MMARKRKRRDMPRHMWPENRSNWQEHNLQEFDEELWPETIDWREIGSHCSQRRNGKPLVFYLETHDNEEE
jgi:hypothetical protein